MFDGEAFGAEIVEAVKGFVARETKALRDEVEGLRGELAELRQRAPERGERGEPGERGEQGPAGKDAAPITDAQIRLAVEAALTPQEGVLSPVAEAVERWLTLNPPSAGEKGEAGERGPQGEPGPKGDPGPQGEAGVDGKDGRDGVDGGKGADGADGVGLAGALIDRTGALILTLTDGTTRNLGHVVGKDGADGINGKDGDIGPPGLGFDDLDVNLGEDGRTIIFSFDRGDIRQSFEIETPLVVDRGAYQEGAEYRSCDQVTHGGSLWIALRNTTARPSGSDDWRLAARRGRDGKDADPQPLIRLIEEKFADAEARLTKRLEMKARG